MPNEITTTIMTIAGGFFIAWFGYRGFHSYALIREKKAHLRTAGLALREAFVSELNAIDPLVMDSQTDAFKILDGAFPKHLKAVTEFEVLLDGECLVAFSKAWAEYHCHDSDENQHYLEQYSFHIGDTSLYKENCKLAIERINKLLEFANT